MFYGYNVKNGRKVYENRRKLAESRKNSNQVIMSDSNSRGMSLILGEIQEVLEKNNDNIYIFMPKELSINDESVELKILVDMAYQNKERIHIHSVFSQEVLQELYKKQNEKMTWIYIVNFHMLSNEDLVHANHIFTLSRSYNHICTAVLNPIDLNPEINEWDYIKGILVVSAFLCVISSSEYIHYSQIHKLEFLNQINQVFQLMASHKLSKEEIDFLMEEQDDIQGIGIIKYVESVFGECHSAMFVTKKISVLKAIMQSYEKFRLTKK